jgi:hypothetical protein
VRLTDTGGALAAAEFRDRTVISLPRIGTRIAVCGHVRYDTDHDWYVVDPVHGWVELRA